MCDSVIFIFLNVLPLSWTSQHHHNHHHHCRRRRRRRLCRRRNHNQLRFCRVPNAIASKQRGQTNTAHWLRWRTVSVCVCVAVNEFSRSSTTSSYYYLHFGELCYVRATEIRYNAFSAWKGEAHNSTNRNGRAEWVHGLIIEMAYFIRRLSSHTHTQTQKNWMSTWLRLRCVLSLCVPDCPCYSHAGMRVAAYRPLEIFLSWIHLARPIEPAEPAPKRRTQRQTEPKFIGLLRPLCMRWDLRCLRPNSVVAISVSNGSAAKTKKM